MTDIQLFSLFVFVATVLIVVAFHSNFIAPRQAKMKVNRRIALLQQGTSGAEALTLLRRERWLGEGTETGALGRLHRLAMQSGIRLDPKDLGFKALLILLACYYVISLKMGVNLTTLLLSVPATLAIAFVIFSRARARRIQKFREQLPEVLELLVRSLRAGHPLPVSFSLAAREIADPAGTEFGIVSDEIQFGASVTGAINNMAGRVGDPDLDYVVTCIAIQSQTGGNLGEVLTRLAKLIRERFRLFRKVQALTSEARFSAIALSCFPVALFGLVNLIAPNYYGEVWGKPSFNQAILGCIAMLTLGNFVMRRLANVKY